MEARGIALTEGYLKNTFISNNYAGNYAAGIAADGAVCSLSLVGNVVFESNVARSGAGLTIAYTKLINVTGAIFFNNRYLFEIVLHADC